MSANPDHVRKALAAVLAHHGLRARPVGGAHVNTGAAAAAYVSDDPSGIVVMLAQDMRGD